MASKQPPTDGKPIELTAEQIATLAKKFTESEYGEWFLATVKTQRDGYLTIAQDIKQSSETKLAALERAAGIGEVLAAIDSQVLYHDHPEYFTTKELDEEEQKAEDLLTNW